MKAFVFVTLLLAGVWLMMVLTLLSVDMYPRRQVFQRTDDAAKAILIAVYLLVGAGFLMWGD